MAAKLSRLIGIVFLALGVLGFIPPFTSNGAVLGRFPTSLMENIGHIVLGLWGLGLGGALYLRAIAIICAALAIIGLLPMGRDFLGMFPLGGDNVWLHAVLAVITGYFGFGKGK